MSSYTDVLMKKDMYKEYKQSVDRYLPIEQIQKEMEKNNLKYVLHQYLRVRNLCDQGIDDPDDVAEILGIPPYMAEDLVYEYYLIPKQFDRRNYSMPVVDSRMELLIGLPYLIEPTNFLNAYPEATAIDVAIYVGTYSIYWFGSVKQNPFLFSPPIEPVIRDDEAFEDFEKLKNIQHNTPLDTGVASLDLAISRLPTSRRSSWIIKFKDDLKARIIQKQLEETEKQNGSSPEQNGPIQIDKKIWRQYPGNQKPVGNLYV